MVREHIHEDGDLNYMHDALENRKNEIKFIQEIAEEIISNKDKIDSLVIGMESGDKTYVNWYGSINGCFGLAGRIVLSIENVLKEEIE